MTNPDDAAPQNIQNVAEGASATQVNHPQAPVIMGGEGNTYNFHYGVPAPPQRTPSGVPYNVPHRGTLYFVGRDEDLETLHQQLQTANTISISAIAGMGGIGKTELALQYALKHLQLEDYPGGVCWLRASEDVVTDCGVCAISLGSERPRRPGTGATGGLVLATLAGKNHADCLG